MALVTVVGSYNRDLIFNTPTLPQAGETRLGKLQSAHGGKGFNQAVACCRLGTSTVFIGALGTDSFADDARHYAAQLRLDCHWQSVPTATGVAAIVCDQSGENQIVVAPGANALLAVEHVTSCTALLSEAKVLLVQLETDLAAVKHAAQIARSAGAIVLVNPAPVPPQLDWELLQLADIVTPNESEFAALCRIAAVELPAHWQDLANADLHALCRSMGLATLVITLGARGGFFSRSEEAGHEHFGRYSAAPATVVDTTGAGDAFNGALAAGLAEGWPLETALPRAAAVAAVAIGRAGGAPAMPDRLEAGWPALP